MPVDTVTVHIEYIPDDQPLVTLTIGTPETGVSIEDSTLFPTPSQHAAGDWRTQQGGNSYSSLQERLYRLGVAIYPLGVKMAYMLWVVLSRCSLFRMILF